MDAGRPDRDLMPPRRRFLLATLLALLVTYAGAFALFATHSRDFIVVRLNEEARTRAADHTLALPASLSFRAGAGATRLLGAGWHRPEEQGTWTSRRTAWLYLPVTTSAHDLTVTLRGRAFVAQPRPRLTLSAFAGEVLLGSWTAELGRAMVELSIDVPASLVVGEPLELRLEVDEPVSPRRLGLGGGDRLIGFRLQLIEISPVAP